MSIKVMTYVWEHANQKATNLLMLLAIADHCNDEGVCYPSVTKLARKCRLQKRGAQKILRKLTVDGEISIVLNKGVETKVGFTNLFYLSKYRESLGLPVIKSTDTYPPIKKNAPQDMGEECPTGHGEECPTGHGEGCPTGHGEGCPTGHGEGCPTGHGGDVPQDMGRDVLQDIQNRQLQPSFNRQNTTTTTASENFSEMDGDLGTEKDRAVGKEIGRGDNKQQRQFQDQGEPETENATIEPQTVGSDSGADSGVNLIFDFALKDFIPEQRQRVLDMLKPVPNADQQSVLDEFNTALSKNTVRSPWAYFSTLIRQYSAGTFIPTSDFAAPRKKTVREIKKIAAQKPEAIKACQFCTESGDLHFNIDGKKSTVWCDHDAEHITRYAKEKNAIIESAKAGNPDQPTPPPLAPQADSDGQDILKQASNFSAPSPRQPFRACSEEEEAALDKIAAADSLDPDTAARFDAVMSQLTAHLAMPR